jgi:hypothetical protein
MTLYNIALFLHVVGALGIFAVLGVEWAAAGALRHATDVAEARPWFAQLRSLGRLGGPSGITILVTGIYMGTTAGGRQAWIGLGLLGLVFLAVVGGIGGRRVAAIARELYSPSMHRDAHRFRLQDPLLVASLRVRTAVAMGVVFLMTSKPPAGLALAAMGAALVLGLAWSTPAFARRRSSGVELAQ